MIRRRFSGLVHAVNAMNSDPRTLSEIPRLPFLDGRSAPPCAELGSLFESAGDDSRIDNPHRQAEVKAFENAAKSVCNACPVRLDCRAYAISTRQPWGVWGATNPHERQEWRRQHGRLTWEDVAAMSDEQLRRKFESVPTIELFSGEAYRRDRGLSGERSKSGMQRAIAYGNCPNCLKSPCAVVVQGDHWVWRTHYYQTWGSEKRMCVSSNVALCTSGERHDKPYGGTPITCPHTTEPLDAA